MPDEQLTNLISTFQLRRKAREPNEAKPIVGSEPKKENGNPIQLVAEP